MFRDEREAALARAEVAEQRARELEARASKLEAALAERDAELARLRELVKDSDTRKAKKKQAEEDRAARKAKEKQAEEDRAAQQAREKHGQETQAKPERAVASWFSQRQGAILGTVGIALCAAAVVFGFRAYIGYQAISGAGELVSIEPVKLEAGKQALLCLGKVDQGDWDDDYRLDLVALPGGTRIKRVVLESSEASASIAAAAPGRIWLEARDKLSLRSVPGLEPVARWDDLVRAIPALAVGLHGGIKVDGWSGQAAVTTKKGEQLLIDSVSLKARPFAPAREELAVHHELGGGVALLESARLSGLLRSAGPLDRRPNAIYMDSGTASQMSEADRTAWRTFPRLRTLGASRSSTARNADLGDSRYAFAGHPRATLEIARPQSPGTLAPKGASMIDPHFVAGATEVALTLPEGHGFIVLHKETLDSRDDLLLSRVTTDGKLQFTFKAPGHTVALGHLAGDLVVLAIKRSDDAYLLGLGWSDGRERWRYPL